MKTFVIAVAVLAALLLVAGVYWKWSDARNRSSNDAGSNGESEGLVRTIFYDDIGPQDRDELFENIFVQDATCEGLRLVRWSQHTPEENAAVLRQPHWAITFRGVPPQDDFSSGEYGVSMTLFPRGVDGGGVIRALGLSDVLAKEAVHEVCFVAKQKGGTVSP